MMAPTMPAPPVSTRTTAADILRQWRKTGRFPDRTIQSVTHHRAALMEMVYGTVRLFRRLEAIRAELAPRRPSADIDCVLLLGLYQLLYMDQAPDHAVVNDTVETAKSVGGKRAAGLINAVLRRAIRERESLLEMVETMPVPVRLSHPDALVERWNHTFGEKHAEQLCLWNNQVPEVVIRPNRTSGPPDSFLAHLAEQDIHVIPHPAAPDACFILPRGLAVMDVPGYEEGAFSVQDPSTLAAIRLLDPQPGETVIDLCAAPGGKTVLIAEAMQHRGRLIAADLHPDRLHRLSANLERAGMAWVDVRRADAANAELLRGELGLTEDETVDRILLDVPCTNTGVLRRRADARWRFSLRRMWTLNRRQHLMLDCAAPLIRPGGVLLYSTCSLEPEENEELIAQWLSRHPEFRLADAVHQVPPESRTDGAYAARLERTE
jgi:16S rRNA (cytosine967-C5)-methyltransferase